ncbi:MAG TPA: DUF2271 domain-containing protein [Propionibacteriaceae bacterium]|nr:DUF2271 domain-containing protein [Propionibacteriaceae bacterium]HQE31885.1 DUF2271 domain-containing protein [Propionibacteriaceae bacterium]
MSAESRFSAVTRRAFVGGATAAAVLGLAACTDDRSALATGSSPATAQSQQSRGAGSATAGPASTGSAGSTSPAATAAVTVAFTYAATGQSGGGKGGGPARNPYIAVWVEDAAGTLVRTISLWHLQGRDNWLNELRRWYQVSGGKDTGSSATRAAGSYQVAWDLTNLSGARVSPGRLYVCVEASREHGPYSLAREQVDLARPGATKLADAGELSGITVTVAG